MRLAINAVKEGEAAAAVSAGNTGALMAMAKFVLKTLPGIDRPAIATVLPGRSAPWSCSISAPTSNAAPRICSSSRSWARYSRAHAGRAQAARRPAQCRNRGAQGRRCGARSGHDAAREPAADRLPRFRRRHGRHRRRGRRGGHRRLHRQRGPEDRGRDGRDVHIGAAGRDPRRGLAGQVRLPLWHARRSRRCATGSTRVATTVRCFSA